MAEYRKFKKCLEVTASSCRVTLAKLQRERNVGDFLNDIAGSEELIPQELAIRALTTLCVEGVWLDGVVAIAVIAYLDETVGHPVEDRATKEQKAKDLGQIVRSSNRTEKAYRQWLNSWYA